MKKLKILFIASEVAPFAKSGGLADVASALPQALKKMGHDVRVVMPRYYIVDKSNLTPLIGEIGVPMGSMGEAWAGVFEGRLGDVPIYFIEHEHFFGRRGLYGDGGFSFTDNDNRFIFFTRASMQLAKKLHFKPDILHANDWHTAVAPLFLNTHYKYDEAYENCASVFTIHNMQHQGQFYKGVMDVLDVGWHHFNHHDLEEHDGVNLLKSAIVHADAVTTVSNKYAQEIKTPEFGWGLQNTTLNHSNKLYGILNGVDYNEWSPAVDGLIASNYDVKNMKGKAVCKKDLQKEFGLKQTNKVPIIGLVGRLVEQKGIDLIASSIFELLKLDIQIVLLGTGEYWAEHFFSDISAKYPDKFACYIGYRNDLAHKIEAGSDFFLMPSNFEPCGLNQIYSLRYGTLPIVRATGGLDDTIENYDDYSGNGTGFKFYDATSMALINTVGWAVDTWYNNQKAMKKLVENAMSKHFSWEDAAASYTDIYELALAKRIGKR